MKWGEGREVVLGEQGGEAGNYVFYKVASNYEWTSTLAGFIRY